MRLEEIARAKALDCDTIEIWFADEARVGQKNKITRRWAKRGTRPSAPRDQRTASTYIFGAVCPKRGKGAALILPACNTEAMNLQLATTRCWRMVANAASISLGVLASPPLPASQCVDVLNILRQRHFKPAFAAILCAEHLAIA